MRRLLASVGCVLALVLLPLTAHAGGGPSETVVLINEASPDSVRVGEAYVAARHIPPTNVCRVTCTPELTVSRVDFVRDVVAPLRAHLDRVVRAEGVEAPRTLRERARFVVFTQGMPIRADGPGGAVSTAEMLGLLDTDVCGQDGARLPRIRNPYTQGVAPGPTPQGQQLFLVTALLSSTADEALGLIEHSVASDGTAPAAAHWIYQDAAGAAGVRNGQYDAARKTLEEDGHTTEHVGRGKDVATEREKVMGYMSGGSYSALSPDGVATNEYLPGAICDMLQSFGAVPRNFAPEGEGGSQFPVTHMVRAGITGVHGTVAEPYNVAFPPADLFTPYANGYTLAETFHQKIPFRYWMNLVLGDPLCAPYADRPKIDVDTSGAPGVVKVSAPGAVRVAAFVDGVAVGAVDAEEAAFELPLGALAAGERTLLVEAVGPGSAEPRGWTTTSVSVRHEACAPRTLPGVVTVGVPLDVPLTREPRSFALDVSCAGEAVPHTADVSGDALRVEIPAEAATPLSGRDLDLRLTLDGSAHEWRATVGPARLVVEADDSVTAGSALDVHVRALDAQGETLPGWTGTLELHSVVPPVRWSRGVLDADGSATLRFTSPKTGAVELAVRVPGTPLTVAHTVRVEPAAAHHATTPLSRMPLGQAADVPIRLEDRFGNLVPEDDMRLEVTFPDDPHARGSGKVTLRGGRAVLHDVILTRPGRQRVVIRERRRTWSQPQEGVEVRPDTVRAWLVSAPHRGEDATALFEGDPGEGLASDGGAPGGRLFRRLRDGDATVDLPAAGSRDGDAVVAVAFVEALDDSDVTLRLAAAARVRVLLDGTEVFDGVPGQTNLRKAPADAAELTLSAGLHRLTVVVERKGRFAFRLGLGREKEPFVPMLRVVPDAGEPPDTACVSGRVLRAGGGPVAGARVEVQSGEAAPRIAQTALDGSWCVPDLPDGEATVRLVEAPGIAAPAERTVDVDGEHVTDVDFRLP